MKQNGPVAILPELREFLIRSLSIILPNEHLHFSQLTKKDQPIPLVGAAVVFINNITSHLISERRRLSNTSHTGLFHPGAQARVRVIDQQMGSLANLKLLSAHIMEIVANADQTALQCEQELYRALEDHLVITNLASNIDPGYEQHLMETRDYLLKDVKPLKMDDCQSPPLVPPTATGA